MGIYDAFSGLVYHPYIGAQQEGAKGFGKGLGRGAWAFPPHILAGTYRTRHFSTYMT